MSGRMNEHAFINVHFYASSVWRRFEC